MSTLTKVAIIMGPWLVVNIVYLTIRWYLLIHDFKRPLQPKDTPYDHLL